MTTTKVPRFQPSHFEAGTAAFAFYDGLWVPLLREGQAAVEAERHGSGLLPESLVQWAAERLLAKEVRRGEIGYNVVWYPLYHMI